LAEAVQPADQRVGRAGPIRGDQQIIAAVGGDLCDRGAQHVDDVFGGVGPGPTRAGHQRGQLPGVVDPHPEAVKPEGLLERTLGVLLAGVGQGDRAVDPQHDRGAHTHPTGIARFRYPVR
jgi:hypothetical protein